MSKHNSYILYTLMLTLVFSSLSLPVFASNQSMDEESDKRENVPSYIGAPAFNQAYQEHFDKDSMALILQEAVNAYILLDPDEVTPEAIQALQGNGNIVSAYISIGTAETWREDFETLKPYTTQNQWAEWKDEYFVQRIRPQVIWAMEARIDRVADMGFDWIEFDNMDFAFDEINKIRYGINVSQEEATDYYQNLCAYAQEKGLKVMAKNMTEGAEDFDGVTFESYEDNFNWWDREDLKAFLRTGKLGLIIHYGDDNPAQTYLTYKEEYGDGLSILIESNYLMRYIHY